MLLFLPHLPTISRPQLRVRAPVVKVRNLECAVQDSKTLQKHTQTIISQHKLLDISSHPIAHQPSVINGRCIPPNYRFLMRPSVTGIGQSVRQFRACQFFCVWGLEVGGDSVGVGGGELGEGLFPVGGGASLDEACGGCSFVGGFACVCEALGGSFVFDVADGEP